MDKFIKTCRSAPRITSMAEFFKQTAAGVNNAPCRAITADTRMFTSSSQTEFSKLLLRNSGAFVKHYFASIPYSLEEECRLGTSVLNIAKRYPAPLNVYCLGMAEGAMARTISQLSNGKINTLTTSPTAANEKTFYENGTSPNAYFICTPFFELPNYLKNNEYEIFSGGFDIIIEDTTFQMYSPDRDSQIGFVKRLLKKDGLFILTEKFRCENREEYEAREEQKDKSYKRRFFNDNQLNIKREVILNKMADYEVTLAEMQKALDNYFTYKAIYWNSGNFYSVVASSSKEKFECFLKLLGKECIPFEYVYQDLPVYL
ncbi:hypothetical protein [Citrobacter werkmanii]|uniref:hypothetical protein n=1 Tax=Citrobacter werkmanii TaxID=67827 RepID=UPI00265A0204|nr:hypothetical protein [Citrobacter werkmanii]